VNSALLSLLAVSALAAPLDAGAATELRYSGSLTRLSRDAEGQTVKRFSLYCLVTPQEGGGHRIGYLLDERGNGGWAWPERFGNLTFNERHEPSGAATVQLLQDHEGNLNLIPLPSPLFPYTDQLAANASWNAGNEAYQVQRETTLNDRACWQVEAATNFGRRKLLWIEKGTPLLVAAEARVFMGQGEEFSLRMQLESQQALDEAQLATVRKPFEILLKLQSDLQRGENARDPELDDTQLAKARDVLQPLEQAAEDTPFSRLASVISRDVKLQLQRSDEVVQLAKKFTGQPAPEFQVPGLEKKQAAFGSGDLLGKITVLHFWEYQAEPLVEPYGQIGYLDYLHSRRRKLGVQIVGVAVDPRLAAADTATAATRSISRLKSFMNVGYPITVDSGEILGKFGDPRRLGAKLPLWVVIDPEGKVVHYSVGFFKINPDEGLRELDDVLVRLIQEQRAKEKGGE